MSLNLVCGNQFSHIFFECWIVKVLMQLRSSITGMVLRLYYIQVIAHILIYGSVVSFRQVGSFGIDTIRKFSCDVSELAGFTAYELEDILQVCSSLFCAHWADKTS